MCYGFLSSLIDLPFSWYSTFKIEAKYGFNTTTLARFIKDLLLSAVFKFSSRYSYSCRGSLDLECCRRILVVLAWLAYILFILAVQWIYPTFIAPLFNKFTPLPDGELKTRLEGLLSRIGFASKGAVCDGCIKAQRQRQCLHDGLSEEINASFCLTHCSIR